MKRREFITLLGSAVACPLAAQAQQATMPVIGFLGATSRTNPDYLRGISPGTEREAGYVEGENVAIAYRWAENQMDRLPELAADLVRRRGRRDRHDFKRPPPAFAAKAATATIPIVFMIAKIRSGSVLSQASPGRAAT